MEGPKDRTNDENQKNGDYRSVLGLPFEILRIGATLAHPGIGLLRKFPTNHQLATLLSIQISLSNVNVMSLCYCIP
jgi:hypothetical protein